MMLEIRNKTGAIRNWIGGRGGAATTHHYLGLKTQLTGALSQIQRQKHSSDMNSICADVNRTWSAIC